MMNKRLLGSVLLAWLVLPWMPGTLGAQEEPSQKPPAAPAAAPWTAQPEELYRRPGELAVRLANGMVAIVKENKVAPVAEIRMYVRTGSIYEQEYLGAGLSHLFEHLLVGGQTKTRTEADSLNLLQQIGAQWNAYTTKDHTCYHMTVPARHIGTALNLIADWVTRPAFPPEAFEREWGVVQRELEMYYSNPDFQLSTLLADLRYREHPARYPVIGYQPILQTLTRQDVLSYYQRMYVPDRTVLCIVGDINAEGMLQAVQKEFADFSRRPVAAIVLPAEPAVLAPREMVKVMPSMQGPVKMVLGFPSIKLEDADLYPLDTLAAILGSGQNSRLYQALHEKEQLVLSISAYSDTPAWAEGTFAIVCELAGEQVAPAQAAIWREMERIQTEPVQPEELARVKKQLQVDHVRANQTAEQQAASLGQDYLATGDPHFSEAYVDRIQQVTAEQVQLAARKYLRADRQIRLIVTPRPLPAAGTKAAEPSVAGAIKKITLDNGLRVLIKRNPSVPLVDVRLFILGGLMQETDENNGISNLMAQLSTKGTRQY
ncbi:MAG: insulinase family protein, partial [Sedimentisphaerales bacterium]|nr:insulinase family protein [Sedimentisphaerales bacterium]